MEGSGWPPRYISFPRSPMGMQAGPLPRPKPVADATAPNRTAETLVREVFASGATYAVAHG